MSKHYIFGGGILADRHNQLFCNISQINNRQKKLHRPGIEPGPPAWQASILPLNHRCYMTNSLQKCYLLGFCVFAIGASLMAISLLVPTCANLLGGRRLAAFASGDNSPNEPPIRIYPSATPKFKISPTKLTGGHKISPTR